MGFQVTELSAGLMIGHTTPTGFRLWGRGAGANSAGVAQVTRADTGEVIAVKVFPFVPFYDQVGIVDFGHLDAMPPDQAPLDPSTRYHIQMGGVGGITADDLSARLLAGDTLDWSDLGEISKGSVRTFPDDGAVTPTSFILGSCRDPNGPSGETTFGHIKAAISGGADPKPDFILMTGDQIYVDLAGGLVNWIKDKVTGWFTGPTVIALDAFWQTYRDAFGRGKPKFGSVVRNLPSYMMLDDHEVQNDWSGGKFRSESGSKNRKFKMETLDNAQRAFEAYQASLGKGVATATDFGEASFPGAGMDKAYWFDFRHGACDFFMADVRTGNERHCETDQEPKVLSEVQFGRLKDWLLTDRDRVKFIVSPVAAFPDTNPRVIFSAPRDKWGSGVDQRNALFDFIRDKDIPKVVFLSGDFHVSYVAKLTHKDDDNFKVHQIVSSAFHWGLPGLNLSNFTFGPMELPNVAGNRPSQNYTASRFSSDGRDKGVHMRDNFARVIATSQGVKVEFVRGANGRSLETVEFTF